jgi:hypothetical protein
MSYQAIPLHWVVELHPWSYHQVLTSSNASVISVPDFKHVQQVGWVKRNSSKSAHLVKTEEAVLKELRTAEHAPKASLPEKKNPKIANPVPLDGTNHKKRNQPRAALTVQQDGGPLLMATTKKSAVRRFALIS